MKHFKIKQCQDNRTHLGKIVPMELFHLTRRYLLGRTLDNTPRNHIFQSMDYLNFRKENHQSIVKVITLIRMAKEVVVHEINKQLEEENHVVSTLSFRGLQNYMQNDHREFVEKVLHEAWITFAGVVGGYVKSDKTIPKGGVIPSGNMVTDGLYKPFQRIVSSALNAINFVERG